MNAATTKEQGDLKSEIAKREEEKLFSGDVCGEDERELESHAAGFLADGLGIDARAEAEGNDADGSFAGLVFCGADRHVKLDELKRLGLVANMAQGELLRVSRNARHCRANAWNFLCGVFDAFVNFGQGFGYKLAEVHG